MYFVVNFTVCQEGSIQSSYKLPFASLNWFRVIKNTDYWIRDTNYLVGIRNQGPILVHEGIVINGIMKDVGTMTDIYVYITLIWEMSSPSLVKCLIFSMQICLKIVIFHVVRGNSDLPADIIG